MDRFYEKKKLSEFTDDEWEQICMKCGRCCMIKYDDYGLVHFSNRICRYFNLKTGRCSCYDTRLSAGRSCAKVDMHLLENNLDLLPETCAYRLLYEGKPLPSYHPLITGDENSPVKAGITVKSLDVYSEAEVSDALFNLHVKSVEEQWCEEKFLREEVKIFEKYSPKYLLSYPFPLKKSKNQKF